MSLKNINFTQNKLILENFEAKNAFTIKENINSIVHQVDEQTGEYVIKNANNDKVLSVNLDGTLTNTSFIKTHISNVVAPLVSQVSLHQNKLDNHDSTLSTVQDSITSLQNTVPTDENFTNLTNQVNEMQTYINNLKIWMNALKEGFGGDLDFTDVI